MRPYLTPARYREMGFGVDLGGFDDSELVPVLAQATAVVNSYCNVPRIPQEHDYRGGVITGEQHSWRYRGSPLMYSSDPWSSFPRGSDSNMPRFYPLHWPIKSVEQFRIFYTTTSYIEIPPDAILIHNGERYLEVVWLAFTTAAFFNNLIFPFLGVATPVAKANYTYGWGYEVVDEVLLNSDGLTWHGQNQFWSADPAPVISVNGTIVTTGYVLDLNEGSVTFSTALAATDIVTASYTYTLPSDISYGTGEIATYLLSSSATRARGLFGLQRLRVAEVELETPRRLTIPTATLADQLATLVPAAAILLDGYKSDNITVR